MNSQPLIDVVILNWNLPHDTNLCVQSVLRSDYPAFRVIVVDNGSTDENQALLDVSDERVTLICTQANLGFAGGCNAGIRYALEHQSDYVLLINNDTTIAPDMLAHLVEPFKHHSDLGVVGPLIYYASEPTKVWFSGERFWRKLYVVRLGLRLKDSYTELEEVDFVSGCGMLVPRQVWETVGLLDPAYFMYYEDLDFCVRVKQHGFWLACAPQAHMWHAVSASSGGSASPAKQRFQVRSSLIFYQRHTSGLWMVVNLGLRFGNAVLTASRQLLTRRLSLAAVRAFIAGIRDPKQSPHSSE